MRYAVAGWVDKTLSDFHDQFYPHCQPSGIFRVFTPFINELTVNIIFPRRGPRPTQGYQIGKLTGDGKTWTRDLQVRGLPTYLFGYGRWKYPVFFRSVISSAHCVVSFPLEFCHGFFCAQMIFVKDNQVWKNKSASGAPFNNVAFMSQNGPVQWQTMDWK